MSAPAPARLDQAARLSIILIAIVATGFALSAAQDIVAPVFLALTSTIVMAPILDKTQQWGLSRTAGAFLCLILAVCIVIAIILVLQPIVLSLIDQAPVVLNEIEIGLRRLKTLTNDITRLSEDMAQAMQVDKAASAEADAMPTVTDALLLAPSLLAQGVMFAGTLFFALLTRHEIYPWIAKAPLGICEDGFVHAERQVSRYFLTITLINASLGLAVGAMLTAVGLPGAVQWGLLAVIVNYIVYLGPAVFAASLLFAGIAAFDGAYSVAPAVLYLMLNMTEGQFITPALVGREMRINPLIVFLSVTFGLWFWGVIGGIVAIPTLVFISVLRQTKPAETSDG